MGGRGSTRWGGHTKRPLVEEAICVDLVALRRSGLQTTRSMLVTMRIAESAIERNLEPRKGRGWGRRSVTVHERALRELAREYETRWGRPFLSPSESQSDSALLGC
jgi:hypothetical protein